MSVNRKPDISCAHKGGCTNSSFLASSHVKLAALSDGQVLLGYLFLLLNAGWLWLLNGSYTGAVAGGIFFGLIYGAQHVPQFKRFGLGENIALFLSLIGFIALYGVKKSVFMDMEWKPAPLQDVIGLVAFVGVGAIGVPLVIDTRSGVLMERPEPLPTTQSAAPTPTQARATTLKSWQLHASYVPALIAIPLLVAATFPSIIGTPSTTLVRHDVIERHSDAGLLTTLEDMTHVEYQLLTADKAKVVYQATLTVPVVPFPVTSTQLTSNRAKQRFMELDDMPVVEQSYKVELVRSGAFGWKAVTPPHKMDFLSLSKDYQVGNVKASKMVDQQQVLYDRLLHSLFMSPFLCALPWLILFISGLTSFASGRYLTGLIGSAMAVYISYGPMLILHIMGVIP